MSDLSERMLQRGKQREKKKNKWISRVSGLGFRV
jgi:hypothetical protein